MQDDGMSTIEEEDKLLLSPDDINLQVPRGGGNSSMAGTHSKQGSIDNDDGVDMSQRTPLIGEDT